MRVQPAASRVPADRLLATPSDVRPCVASTTGRSSPNRPVGHRSRRSRADYKSKRRSDIRPNSEDRTSGWVRCQSRHRQLPRRRSQRAGSQRQMGRPPTRRRRPRRRQSHSETPHRSRRRRHRQQPDAHQRHNPRRPHDLTIGRPEFEKPPGASATADLVSLDCKVDVIRQQSACHFRCKSDVTGYQLQPLVEPQLGQAWHAPARCIWTPHCMHIGASDLYTARGIPRAGE